MLDGLPWIEQSESNQALYVEKMIQINKSLDSCTKDLLHYTIYSHRQSENAIFKSTALD
jgi:hypothetical protein